MKTQNQVETPNSSILHFHRSGKSCCFIFCLQHQTEFHLILTLGLINGRKKNELLAVSVYMSLVRLLLSERERERTREREREREKESSID